MAVAIKETIKLPSCGNGYSKKIPSEVELRAMTTMEEKIRLSSNNGFKVIPEIIDRCKNDDSFNAEDLYVADVVALMYGLRSVTYGKDYKITLGCPHCGHTNNKVVDLDELKINYADNKFSGSIEITLPVSEKVLDCKLLTIRESNEISNEVEKTLAKYPEYIGDPSLIIRWKYIINSVDGEEKNLAEIQELIENLHARDYQYLVDKYAEFEDSIGIDLDMVEVCDSCGKTINFVLSTTEEFFRPQY